MERIAIISDIHSNITALKAVLKDIENRGVERIYCLGDMLVKCSSPYECVSILLDKCDIVLKGNCEDRAVGHQRTEEHRWNQSQLTDSQKEILRNLPLSHEFYMSGLKIRLMHASPDNIHQPGTYWERNEGFYERMNHMFENTEYLGTIGKEEPDVVIFGHVHRPMMLRLDGNKTLLNPGSVSNSSDIITKGDKSYTYGSYIIIEGELDSKQICPINYSIIKFPYDNEREAEKIMKTDMPNKEAAAHEIRTGEFFNRRAIEFKMGFDPSH